jgi:hypothetical protein
VGKREIAEIYPKRVMGYVANNHRLSTIGGSPAGAYGWADRYADYGLSVARRKAGSGVSFQMLTIFGYEKDRAESAGHLLLYMASQRS